LSKVRALTRVATPENEARLLELALYATGAQLERMCRGYRSALAADVAPSPEDRCVRQRVLPSGMVKLEIVLSPDEADLVMRALDRAREVHHEGEARTPGVSAETRTCENEHESASAETGWPSLADGVVTVAESFLTSHSVSRNGGERFQVIVHVDQDVLAPDGALAGTLDDGTRVSAETLRRVACDCGVVAVAGQGEAGALNIGRRARTIPPMIRRALALRDHGCCFPGCTHTRFLHGHHIQHWLHGGETSVDNPACTAHHHLVHEGGWSVARTVEGELRFTSPAGKALPPEPPRERIDDALVWLHEWAEDRCLDLGPDANLPLWDGTRPDYDYAVSALLAAG
jgi:hypothetical protein